MKHGLQILTGNAHPQLAETIANELETPLLEASVSQFPDEETSVHIQGNVREQDVFLIQPTGPPANHNIMEALVMVDALKRASAGRITAVLPYYGYARQDRKEKSRVPISAKLVANIFEAAGVDRLLSVDLHAHQIQGFSDLPFDHLYAGKTIRRTLKEVVQDPVIVAPDVGAAKGVKSFARKWNADWAIVDKDRIDANTTEVTAIIGKDVKGRTALIVDDVATTAGTLLNTAEALKEQGAERVVAAITHGVLCGNAVERIENSKGLDELYVTDSLPRHWDETGTIKQISIAELLARAIYNINKGDSVTGLF